MYDGNKYKKLWHVMINLFYVLININDADYTNLLSSLRKFSDMCSLR